MSQLTFNIRSLSEYRIPADTLPVPLPSNDFFLKNVISCFQKKASFSDDLAFLQAPKHSVSLYQSIHELQISTAYSLILTKCEEAFDNLICLLTEMSKEPYFLHSKDSNWEQIHHHNGEAIEVVNCAKNYEVLIPKKIEDSLARIENKIIIINNALSAISVIHMVIQINNLAIQLFNKKFSTEERSEWAFFFNKHLNLLSEIKECNLLLLPDLIHSALSKSSDDFEKLIKCFKFFESMKNIVVKRSCSLISLKELKCVKGPLSNICHKFESIDNILEINSVINKMLLSNVQKVHELDRPCKMRFWFIKYAGKIKQVNAIVVGSEIVRGAFKIIYKALFIQFIRVGNTYRHEIIPSVYSIVRDPKDTGKILKTLKMLKSILSKIPVEKLDLFVPYPSLTYSSKPNHLELLYPWFHGDFFDAATLGRVPAGLFSKRFYKIKLQHFFQMLIDACNALTEVHRLNIVHSDVKAINLLVRWNKDWRGALSDWDLVENQGVATPRKYNYWSSCAEMGLCTFECDGYGIVITLGEMFFREKFEDFKSQRNLILTPMFDDLLNEFLSSHSHKYFDEMIDDAIKKDRILNHFKRLKLLNDKEIFNLVHHIKFVEGIETQSLVKELMIIQQVHALIKHCIKVDLWMVKEVKRDVIFYSKLVKGSLTDKEVVDYFDQFRLKIIAEWKFNPLDVSVLLSKFSAMHEALSKG